jgi:hypothetical protein
MKKRKPILVLAGAAGIVAAGLAPAAAQGTTGWTVRPGADITVTFGVLTLEGTRSGTETFACDTAGGTAGGNLKAGTNPNPIGHISSVAFPLDPPGNPEGTNCEGPASLAYILTLNDLPYPVNALSYSSGITQLSLTHVHGTFVGPSCSVIFDGEAGAGTDSGVLGATYNNGTHTLRLTKTGTSLDAYHETGGCAGLIKNGDTFTLTGSGNVSPAQTITPAGQTASPASHHGPREPLPGVGNGHHAWPRARPGENRHDFLPVMP